MTTAPRRWRAILAGVAGATALGAAVAAGGSTGASTLTPVSTGAHAGSGAVRVDPPRTFSVVAGGDVLAELRVRNAAAAAAPTGVRFDFGPVFAETAAIVAAADLAICHMETPIGRPGAYTGAIGPSPYGGYLFVAPYEIAGGVRSVGFDRCSTASNHAYDLGVSGIASTIEALAENGLTTVGTARSAAESADTVFEVEGVRLAHLSFTTWSNTVPPADRWRLNLTRDPLVIAARVDAARRAGAEVVLVSVHVSKELLAAPTATDRSLVTTLTAAADVDAVFIHGPHVVQPFEWVDGTPVWWSLGNFVSQMGPPSTGRYASPRTSDGLLARVSFLETSAGFSAVPSSIAICNDFEDRTVRPASLALQRDDITSRVRQELTECLARTRAVVPDAG